MIFKSPGFRIAVFILLGFVAGSGACYALFRQRIQFTPSIRFGDPSRAELAWLDGADPVVDFRRDYAAGERRFWGLHGVMCMELVPAVDDVWSFERIQAQGVRMIPYTSLCLNGQEANHDRAYSYAERYNALLRYQLEK